MSFSILAAVAIGILSGLFIFPDAFAQHIAIVIDIGLCLLLFFVGIDIGRNKEILNQIKSIGYKILLVPISIALGSIVGSILGGFVLGLPVNESGAIGAGFGWYSLSAIELSKYRVETGALAFITNVCREVIALISIPYIARYIGKLEAIAPGGATTMDTSLPVIAKATDANTAVVAFISGVTLSTLVPILVPIIISIKL